MKEKESELSLVAGDRIEFVTRQGSVESGIVKAVLKDGDLNVSFGEKHQLTATISASNVTKKIK